MEESPIDELLDHWAGLVETGILASSSVFHL